MFADTMISSIFSSLISSKVLWASLYITYLLGRWYTQRAFRKRNGCESAQISVRVKDPIIGFDFIYDRLFCQAPDRPHETAYRIFLGNSKTYTISRWTSSSVHTCDSRNLKHMLVTAFNDFELPKVRVSVMSSLLGIGIFTLNGTSWSRARSVLKPSLARSKMDTLPGILEKHFGAFMRHVSPATIIDAATKTATRTMIDLQPLFFAVTMDVATEFLFGRSTGMLDSDEGTNEYDKQFLDDYMLCSEEAVKRMRMGPLSHLQYSKAANEAKRRVFAYVDMYIEESLARNATQGRASSDKNVLTELADAISDRKLLRDQVLHILLASRDTTASLLSNLFFVLSRKPDMYQRLRQEVVNAVGNDQPTFAQLKDMTYLKWCVNESLRLHPVIPSNAREAVRDAVLPHGGGPDGESPLLVPKGTVVMYNFYSMHRDESVFGPRPEEFDPERWDGLRPGWNFLPFNGGPRACIGQQFALLESYYIIARLVQTFASMTSRDETEEWVELSALAMTCRNGVEVSMCRASS